MDLGVTSAGDIVKVLEVRRRATFLFQPCEHHLCARVHVPMHLGFPRKKGVIDDVCLEHLRADALHDSLNRASNAYTSAGSFERATVYADSNCQPKAIACLLCFRQSRNAPDVVCHFFDVLFDRQDERSQTTFVGKQKQDKMYVCSAQRCPPPPPHAQTPQPVSLNPPRLPYHLQLPYFPDPPRYGYRSRPKDL